MPYVTKREYVLGANMGSAKGAMPKRKTAPKGGKFPTSPSCKDGKFEGTAAGKTKRTSW